MAKETWQRVVIPSGKKAIDIPRQQLEELATKIENTARMLRNAIQTMKDFELDHINFVPQALFKYGEKELPRILRKNLLEKIRDLTGEEIR